MTDNGARIILSQAELFNKLDENGLPVGLAEQIAQANAEEGRDPNEAQIIIKRNAPKEREDQQ